MPPSHYELLGISEDAKPKEIIKAYRDQLMKWHPDKALDQKLGDEKVAEYTNRTQDIVAAFNVLMNPDKRTIYDGELRRAREATASATSPPPPASPTTASPPPTATSEVKSETKFEDQLKKFKESLSGIPEDKASQLSEAAKKALTTLEADCKAHTVNGREMTETETKTAIEKANKTLFDAINAANLEEGQKKQVVEATNHLIADAMKQLLPKPELKEEEKEEEKNEEKEEKTTDQKKEQNKDEDDVKKRMSPFEKAVFNALEAWANLIKNTVMYTGKKGYEAYQWAKEHMQRTPPTPFDQSPEKKLASEAKGAESKTVPLIEFKKAAEAIEAPKPEASITAPPAPRRLE